MQSLGLVVARTSRGTRGVDLICICKSGAGAFTILAEAKTSRKPYGLPVADQRALRDYVRQAVGGLQTLPPLRVVTVVGHDARPSVPTRLRALESEAGMPIRFCSTQTSCRASSKARRTLDGARFLTLVLESPPILQQELADRLAAIELEAVEAHQALIATLLRRARSRLGGKAQVSYRRSLA